MNIGQLVNEVNEKYKNRVKPLIEEKEYKVAFGEMSDNYWKLLEHKDEVSAHSGKKYIPAVKTLCLILERNGDCSEAVSNFEALINKMKSRRKRK